MTRWLRRGWISSGTCAGCRTSWGHLQFEALITTARKSSNPNDFALVALLGLLGLRIFEACGSNIADLGEGTRPPGPTDARQGGKVVLVPLPPTVARAIDQAISERTSGPLLRNIHGGRMDRHAATRRLKHLAHIAGIRMPRMHLPTAIGPMPICVKSSKPDSTPSSSKESFPTPAWHSSPG
ncbi:hypothetical protein [Micromonospora wenchangensis]|uniref:hypothetical protein n=1 Tax=Micromonospora wenchangensis TaxID=1185415 RepID=UPI003444EC91